MEMIDTIVKPLSFTAMLLYFLVAAQGAFYLFGFAKALYNIPSETFIELRKAVDPVVRSRFKVLYLSALAMMFIWLLLIDKTGGFWSYGLILIAFLLLSADLVLILKVSEPVNRIINGDISNLKGSYDQLRHQWLKFISIRGYLSVSGFILLIIHLL